jgi:hypothetical protein
MKAALIVRHMDSCAFKHGDKTNARRQPRPPLAMSKRLLCVYCGGHFTHSSLIFHEETCKVRQKALYATLPRSVRPVLGPPMELPDPDAPRGGHR